MFFNGNQLDPYQPGAKETTAAEKIQMFFKNVMTYQKLKNAMQDIPKFRRKEISATPANNSVKEQLKKIIESTYGIKMVMKPELDEDYVIPKDHYKSPKYMRSDYKPAILELYLLLHNKKYSDLFLLIDQRTTWLLTIMLQIQNDTADHLQETSCKLNEKIIEFIDLKDNYTISDFDKIIALFHQYNLIFAKEEIEELTKNYNYILRTRGTPLTKQEKIKDLLLTAVKKRTGSIATEITTIKQSIMAALSVTDKAETTHTILLQPLATKALENIEKFLHSAGASPSYYSIVSSLLAKEHCQEETKEFVVNFSAKITLQQLMATTQKIKQLILFNKISNIMLDIAINLITGLQVFSAQDDVLQDPLNQQFFYVINSILQLMYTYRDNHTTLNKLYDSLTEEIAAIMIYNGNPLAANYNELFTTVCRKQLSILDQHINTNTWSCSNFLASSGMGAIFATLYSLNTSHQAVYFAQGFYFELKNLINLLHIKQATVPGKVAFVTLNYSSTDDVICIAEIEKIVNKQLSSLIEAQDYVTLIIDNTLEFGSPTEHKLQLLLTKLQQHITTGKLLIILPKSLQKYAILGTSKIMAGNIMVINNGDLKFKTITATIEKHANSSLLQQSPEYPFLSYLLQHAGQFEFKMANIAVENARYLKQLLTDPEILLLPNLDPLSPFVFFKWVAPNKIILSKYAGVIFRESFGFMHSAAAITYDSNNQAYYRINVGVESKELLTEKFFIFQLIEKTYSNVYISIPKIVQIINTITGMQLNPQLPLTKQDQDNLITHLTLMFSTKTNIDYQNNKIFSILFCLLHVNSTAISSFAKELLLHIATTPGYGLSMEAKTYIRTKKFNKPIPATKKLQLKKEEETSDNLLLKYMRTLGYRDLSLELSKRTRGKCLGFASMSIYPMLTGSWDNIWQERLELINKLFHKKITSSHLSIKKTVQHDILALLDGIQIHQASTHDDITESLTGTELYQASPQSNMLTKHHTLLKPVFFEQQQLEIYKVHHSFGCYRGTELSLLLQAIEGSVLDGVLRDNIINTKFNHRIPVYFSSNHHTIMLGYNYRDNTWIIADINSACSWKMQASYNKSDMVDLLYEAFFIHANIISNDQIIIDLTIKIYIADHKEQQLIDKPKIQTYFTKKLTSNPIWQKINTIEQDKLDITVTHHSWLHEAAISGDLTLVQQLLAANADVNLEITNLTSSLPLSDLVNNHSPDFLGFTPILIAANYGHLQIVDLLIKSKANIEIANPKGFTPILMAAQYGYTSIVELLIKNKANIEAKTIKGFTPLLLAAQYGYTAIVELLIQANANIEATTPDGLTPILLATQYGNTEVFELLMKFKANTDIVTAEGLTPTLIAAKKGFTKIFELLIQAKTTNIDAANSKGVTPILMAAQNGHFPIVDILIKAKANIQAATIKGITPILIAAQNGHFSVVDLLIKAKANINAANIENLTPILLATQNGHFPVVDLLIKAKANIEATTPEGLTPLLLAAQQGNTKIVELLIQANANIEATTPAGLTPISLAKEQDNTEVVELLIQAKANIEATIPATGLTPISTSLTEQHNNTKVVESLINNAKANIEATTSVTGLTPISLAKNNPTKVITLLMAATTNIGGTPSSSSDLPTTGIATSSKVENTLTPSYLPSANNTRFRKIINPSSNPALAIRLLPQNTPAENASDMHSKSNDTAVKRNLVIF